MMQFLNFAAEHPLLIAFFAFVIYSIIDAIISGILRYSALKTISRLSCAEEEVEALKAWILNEKKQKDKKVVSVKFKRNNNG